jgi:hypothetical protein
MAVSEPLRGSTHIFAAAARVEEVEWNWYWESLYPNPQSVIAIASPTSPRVWDREIPYHPFFRV